MNLLVKTKGTSQQHKVIFMKELNLDEISLVAGGLMELEPIPDGGLGGISGSPNPPGWPTSGVPYPTPTPPPPPRG